MFLPTTKKEIEKLGWEKLDIIIITGDTYIDSSYIGAAIIGKVLLNAGYKVGIIAQPDLNSEKDITRLGEPSLFWGVTGGSVDSMVANYTALRKKRRSDDFTPGGVNNRRPDRAVIAYSNLIRRYYKNTSPIVLGGIEASLRRIAHYDFWSDKIRKSILFDAKADYLIYGMGEKATLTLAERFKTQKTPYDLPGICYIAKSKPEDALELPSFEKVTSDKQSFIKMFHEFYNNNDPITAVKLAQQQDTRFLVQNPSAAYLNQQELDKTYNLDFEQDVHPFYKKHGKVKTLETIRFSITGHRGCYGECNFCAIAMHQGRTVRWRSENSILKEVQTFLKDSSFKGIISDMGGPTGNMYGFECSKKLEKGSCTKKSCIFPQTCSLLNPDHSKQLKLLNKIRNIKGVKKIFIASGIRYDLILDDKKYGKKYLQEILKHHISGQMKIAPEHTENEVLKLMRKPSKEVLISFKSLFDKISETLNRKNEKNKKQFLTYYLIAAHPGCSEEHMRNLKSFTGKHLKINPEQVQVFTPTPSTYSSLMYYTGIDPFSGKKIFVEKKDGAKNRQKATITPKTKK